MCYIYGNIRAIPTLYDINVAIKFCIYMQEKNVTSEKDSLPDIKDNLSHSERSDMDDILEEVSFREHN